YLLFVSHQCVRFFSRRFFFSSRRRHTRFSRDWSSDVCSSDLRSLLDRFGLDGTQDQWPSELSGGMRQRVAVLRTFLTPAPVLLRSEERRVGKEWRSGRLALPLPDKS